MEPTARKIATPGSSQVRIRNATLPKSCKNMLIFFCYPQTFAWINRFTQCHGMNESRFFWYESFHLCPFIHNPSSHIGQRMMMSLFPNTFWKKELVRDKITLWPSLAGHLQRPRSHQSSDQLVGAQKMILAATSSFV